MLELQFELEHIDQYALSSMSEERLKHYNSILRQQVRELDQETLNVESSFRYAYGIDPFESVSPSGVLQSLAVDLKEIRLNNRTLEQDLAAFEEIRNLKLWLKRCKISFPRRQTLILCRSDIEGDACARLPTTKKSCRHSAYWRLPFVNRTARCRSRCQ